VCDKHELARREADEAGQRGGEEQRDAERAQDGARNEMTMPITPACASST